MKMLSAAALALFAAAPVVAQATVTLDFEGAAGYVNSIGEFYNGGTDSLGQSGPDYGVSFTEAAVALSNDDLGPYYSNAPSPLTVLFAFDATAVMNVEQGLVGNLMFQYSSDAAALGAVNLYSGLDGTGDLLGTVNLAGNAGTGCGDTAFCNFDIASVAFSGVAKSVSFAGNSPNVLYDDIVITVVPEPSTYLMLAAGLAALAVARRRNDR